MRTPKGQHLFGSHVQSQWTRQYHYQSHHAHLATVVHISHVDVASSIQGLGCCPVWMSVRLAMWLIPYCSRSSLITDLKPSFQLVMHGNVSVAPTVLTLLSIISFWWFAQLAVAVLLVLLAADISERVTCWLCLANARFVLHLTVLLAMFGQCKVCAALWLQCTVIALGKVSYLKFWHQTRDRWCIIRYFIWACPQINLTHNLKAKLEMTVTARYFSDIWCTKQLFEKKYSRNISSTLNIEKTLLK